MATAFEDPTLFSMSARENLTLGRDPESDPATDEEVEQALDIAQADFVHDLPWGLDTRIGEQGLALSGGQRQRLALARAVLAKPKVLVLDDTLSALDVHTEKLVEEALAGCSPPRPVWSSPTVRPRSCSPTGWRSSRTAASPTSARTGSCWPRCRPTASCSPPTRTSRRRRDDDEQSTDRTTDKSTSGSPWRGVAQVDEDEAAEAMTAVRFGGGSRRLLRELLAPYKRAI